MKAEVKAEPVEEKQQSSSVQLGLKKKTILDVPPEARRRPKPSYGGLIHFAPDWEAKVSTVHNRMIEPIRFYLLRHDLSVCITGLSIAFRTWVGLK